MVWCSLWLLVSLQPLLISYTTIDDFLNCLSLQKALIHIFCCLMDKIKSFWLFIQQMKFLCEHNCCLFFLLLLFILYSVSCWLIIFLGFVVGSMIFVVFSVCCWFNHICCFLVFVVGSMIFVVFSVCCWFDHICCF